MTAPLTFVLIHGGGMSAAYWDRMMPFVRHPALAIDLPGRGAKPADPMALTVDDCVASVVADVRAAELGDVIVVAHSSGGLVVPGVAAALAPRVRHIVLDAASVPPEGGTGLDAMKPSHRRRVIDAMAAARRDGWVLRTPGPDEPAEKFRQAYGGDELDDDLLAFVTEPVRCVRDSMNFYFQPVSWASVGDVPVTYVRHRRDQPVSPELQDEHVARLRDHHPRVCEIDTGHIPAVTDPELFARMLDGIADEVETPT